MTAIERTAYPQFKPQPSTKELSELYSPTAQEVAFAQSQTKSKRGLLRLLVMLKSFQRLGYFPRSEAVPAAVVNHIRSCLNLGANVSAVAPGRSRYVYQDIIRAYLGVHSYDRKAQKAMATAVAQAAEVMDHPADLINVAIEELVKERYELPAFSTLDRLVRRTRWNNVRRSKPTIATITCHWSGGFIAAIARFCFAWYNHSTFNLPAKTSR